LFEELGYSNTEKRKQDLFVWLQATGKIQPQPQMPATGQPGASGGNPEDQQKQQQLIRLQQILQSEQFKQLPPEEQKQKVEQAKQIMAQIKGQ
jgi:hypothetical protein